MVLLKAIISFFIISICAINLSQIKFKAVKYLFWILSISIIITITSFLSELIAGIICMVLIVIMLYYKKKKIYTSIFYAILAMLLSVLSDNIVSSIITDGFQNGVEIKERFENDIVVYLIISIFILLLAFSISKLLGYLINRKRLIENVTANKKYGLILSSFLVLTFIFIYASVFVEKVSNPLLTIGIYVLYFLVIIIIVYFLITVTKKENEIIIERRN